MKALVVYGSKRGATEELARVVGEALVDAGIDVTVRSAADRTPDIGAYDAVVVGGALYANRWHKDARRFVRRNAAELRDTKVWLFSSGPIGEESPPASEMEPVSHVRHAMEQVGAVGQATFGGRLAEDASGFAASAMAKTMAGDWRDEDAVRHWAQDIAAVLS